MPEVVWHDLAREPLANEFPTHNNPGTVCMDLYTWVNEWPLGELRAVAPLDEICAGQVDLGDTSARFIGLIPIHLVNESGVVEQSSERIIVVPEPAFGLIFGLLLLVALRRW